MRITPVYLILFKKNAPLLCESCGGKLEYLSIRTDLNQCKQFSFYSKNKVRGSNYFNYPK